MTSTSKDRTISKNSVTITVFDAINTNYERTKLIQRNHFSMMRSMFKIHRNKILKMTQ